MKYKEKFKEHLDFVWVNQGGDELRKRLARGDYLGESALQAEAFLKEKAEEAVARYLLSPEHSALREANAAERSNALMADANRTAQGARRIAGLAVVVALLALAAQIFDWKWQW